MIMLTLQRPSSPQLHVCRFPKAFSSNQAEVGAESGRGSNTARSEDITRWTVHSSPLDDEAPCLVLHVFAVQLFHQDDTIGHASLSVPSPSDAQPDNRRNRFALNVHTRASCMAEHVHQHRCFSNVLHNLSNRIPKPQIQLVLGDCFALMLPQIIVFMGDIRGPRD